MFGINSKTPLFFLLGLLLVACGNADPPELSVDSEDTRVQASMPAQETGRVRFAYNKTDLLSEIHGPGVRRVSLGYNERGQVSSVKNAEGEVRFEWNRLGDLKGLHDQTGTMAFQNDANGNLQSMTYPQGDSVTYTHNETGNITSVNWVEKHVLQFERDLFGNIVAMGTPAGVFRIDYDYDKRVMVRTYPNTVQSQFEYNPQGRPIHILHVGPDRRLLLEFSYTYDDTGQVKTVTEESQRGKLSITYEYDPYGQLLSAKYSDGRQYRYEYDAFGNRLKVVGPSESTEATYDPQDRLETLNGQPVSHDAAGNVTSLTKSTYTYNDQDLLTSDGEARYQYNALGLRVEASKKKDTTRFIHVIDDLPYVLAEQGSTTTTYLWADGSYLGQIGPSGHALYFLEDHLGSVRGAMDASGQLVGQAEFSPFGVPIKRIDRVRFGFAGEEQDDAGKVFLRARYYEPKLGRFLSKDPVLPDLKDEGKQNRYAYVGNSPLNYKDRDGRSRERFNSPIFNVPISPIIFEPIKIDPPQLSPWAMDLSVELIRAFGDWKDVGTRNYTPSYQEVEEHLQKFDATRKHPWIFGVVPTLEEAIWPRHWDVERVYVPGDGEMDMDWRASHRYMPKNAVVGGAVLGLRYFFENSVYGVKYGVQSLGIIGENWKRGKFSFWKDSRFADMGRSWVANVRGMDRGIYEWAMNRNKKNMRRSFDKNKSQEDDDDSKKMSNRVDGIFKGGGLGGPGGPGQGPGGCPGCGGPGGGAGGGFGGGPGWPGSSFFKFSSGFPGSQFRYSANRTPNVGGVYLDKAAEVIGNLSGLEGVAFDPVSNRLILIGNEGSQSRLPPMRLDDLAAAFRTVFGYYDEEPGVTIDPNPDNPMAPEMIVRFFGGMDNTHFGYLLFEADRIMKGLSLGKDNLSHQPTTVSVDGYYNLLDLGFSNLGGTHNKGLWSRFWLVPEQVVVKVSEDKKSITFPHTRIRVKTETMKWEQGTLVPAGGKKDEKAEYFAGHFTKYYDDYAKEIPVFQELKTLANLVAFAKWLKESGTPVDLSWLKNYEKNVETPKTTPALTVSDRRQFKKGVTEEISIFGGTDLSVNPTFYKDDGVAAEWGQKAVKAVASVPGIGVGSFSDDNNRKKTIVALPTSQTRAPGSKFMREQELVFVSRVFSSFHNGHGPFGRSWVLDLPTLEIGKVEVDDSKKKNDEKSGKRFAPTFHLTRPFGQQDVHFETQHTDQQYKRLVFLPNRREGIRDLYPEDTRSENRVEYDDGRAEIFDGQGQLVRREFNASSSQNFSYDKGGRLITVKTGQNGETENVSLTYDEHQRISAAKGPNGTIAYRYNAKGDLVKVEKGKDTIEYQYDDRHLVTQIRVNGEISTTIAYDEYGRVLKEEMSDGKILQPDIKTVGTNTVVREDQYGQEVLRTYDAGGRILEVKDSSGGKSVMDYDDLGALKNITTTNPYGDVYKIELSPDGRFEKYTDPEGHVRAFLFDELGKLKQIQDGNHALLTKDYGQTDEGFVESIETGAAKAQTLFDKAMRPVEYTLLSKVRKGEGLVLRNAYNKSGELTRQVIEGRLQQERIFKNQTLIEQMTGGIRTSYAYDDNGRIREAKSDEHSVKFTYDQDDVVKQIVVQWGDTTSNYEFTENGLIKRTTNDGLKDSFTYDDEGRLKSVARSDGETWVIDRSEQTVSTRRNDVLQTEFVFDKGGRLVEMLY